MTVNWITSWKLQTHLDAVINGSYSWHKQRFLLGLLPFPMSQFKVWSTIKSSQQSKLDIKGLNPYLHIQTKRNNHQCTIVGSTPNITLRHLTWHIPTNLTSNNKIPQIAQIDLPFCIGSKSPTLSSSRLSCYHSQLIPDWQIHI